MPGLRRKELLRRTVGRQLPPALLKQPKRPLLVPLREWFRHTDFDRRLKMLERADFGLNSSVIGDIILANRNGEHDYGDFIWRLFILRQWIEAPEGSSIESANRRT